MTRRAERGFTLIELLVALALVAALLGVLFSGIGLGVKSMTRLDDQVARIEARRSLAFALRREIAATYPATEGRVAAATFVGQPAAMSFLSLGAGASAGYTRVWLMLEDAADGSRVVFEAHGGIALQGCAPHRPRGDGRAARGARRRPGA